MGKVNRVGSITKRILKELLHDRRAMAMILVAPILAMTVFGVALGGEVTEVEVAIVNNDVERKINDAGREIRISEEYIEILEDKDSLDITFLNEKEEAIEKVEDGELWAAIVFPADFTESIIEEGSSGSIEMNADRSDPQVFSEIISSLEESLEEMLERLDGEIERPMEINVTEVYGEGAEFSDFLVPGVIAFAIFLLTTLLTLLAFTSEKVNGTLDRLLVSPATEFETVLAYSIAFGIIGAVQSIILVSYGIAAFDLIIEGSIFIAFLVVSLLAMTSQSMGILLSAAAKTQVQAVQMFPFIVLPTFLLSGIFWPIQALPSRIRPLSNVLPPTHAAEALRSVMIRGWGLLEVLPEILTIVLFYLIFVILATLSLKLSRK